MITVLMGVAGSGKTTVGRLLAAELGWTFLDGDDFHSPASVARMAAGLPLTDAERLPWLARLRELIERYIEEGRDAVLACSALKERYRQILLEGLPDVKLVYLRGERELLASRLSQRQGHFFPVHLLESQLRDLEEPVSAVTVDVTGSPAQIVAAIRAALSR